MHDQNKISPANFWVGFSFGAITLAIIGYLFGTKSGRSLLKKLLELSENLEENFLLLVEELEENLAEETPSKPKASQPTLSSLRDVLEKIKVRRKIT